MSKSIQRFGSLTNIEYYKRRFKKAEATATLWWSLLEACYHYTNPSRNLYYWTSQYQGAQKNAKVYDTTAVYATKVCVSKVQQSLTPPQQAWAALVAGSDVPEDKKEEVDVQLKEDTEILFSYLRNSNFDVVIHECYGDLIIGTMALLCNEGPDDRPLQFYSVPLARLALEESATGIADNNWRWWDEIRISDIQAMWPKAKLSPMMLALLKEDPSATIKKLVEGTIFNESNKTYSYVLMHEDHLLIDENLISSPWIVARWSKFANEAFGRGPVIDALPAILTLNEVIRIELMAANFNISKPIMAYSDGVFNPWTFKLEPNTIIPVAPNAAGQFPLQPFPDTANPQFMQLAIADLRMQINNLLFADPLGPIDSPEKSATEMALRQRNMVEVVGPTNIRLQQEFLFRLIDRVVYILQKKGLMRKLIIDGKEIKVKYQSPVVSSQGVQQIDNFKNWFMLMQGTFGPESAVMFLNPVKTPRWAAEQFNVDPHILVSSEELEQMLAQQSEQAQQQQQLAMMEAANNATQPTQPIARSA